MFFVYILKSSSDGRYYYGSTNSLEKRVLLHNAGRVKSTKSRIPFVLHYFEKFNTRKEAFKKEQFFKSINGYLWLKNQKII
ncbi:MAG: GIY-YIG nuclease family protein [Cyclobacteriaceae bacterium]